MLAPSRPRPLNGSELLPVVACFKITLNMNVMPSTIFRLCVATSALLVASLTVITAAEPADIIAKARAHLGSEATLDGVTSLRFVGHLTVDRDPADSEQAAPARLTVEIIFQKPARQRSVITSAQRIETTVLDGYDGWQKVQDPNDATRWTMSLMRSEQIKNLRANVAENVSFFRGLPGRGMNVEDLGPVNIDGVACRKIAFVYTPQIGFNRYFEVATGRLVLTETRQGETIREQGEIRAGGIRFPKQLVTTFQRADGAAGQITIDFDAIYVNEVIDDSLFATPSLSRE